VVFGIVCYNAWVDEPGVIGYRQRGPIVLGSIDNSLRDEPAYVAALLRPGLDASVTDRLQDAAHSKLVINLANAVTALVGFGYREISSFELFQRLLMRVMAEGIQVVSKAGYREHKLIGCPSWTRIRLGANLPQSLTNRAFKSRLADLKRSSMAQDVIGKEPVRSELKSLTGYLVDLAEKNGVEAPYNRAIYEICKERFVTGFEPLDVREVWADVSGKL
jgi:ketopantoate reductase